MKTPLDEIKGTLRKHGWRELGFTPDADREGLDLICFSPFAALGIATFDSPEQINSRWGDCQEQMSQLRKNEAIGKVKDLYLAFIVENDSPTSVSALQKVLGDTRVCRKLYLPLNGKEIAEVVDSIPCLQAVAVSLETSKSNVIPLLDALDLPPDLKWDLAVRSPSKILESVLAGNYKRDKK